MNRYYFRVDDASVLEVVRANSFLEAKRKAYVDYGSMWDRVKWIDPIYPPIPLYPRSTFRK